MKEARILSIDDRGRIVIPYTIRKSLGITSKSQLMMTSDSERKEIKISPVGIGKNLLKFQITMRDEPGSLAKIATVFGNHGISLVYGESVILEKDKTALWTVIGPSSDKYSFEELKEIILEEGGAINVEILPIE